MKQNATIQRQEDHCIGNEAQTQESSLSPDAAFKFPNVTKKMFHFASILNFDTLYDKYAKII